MVDQITPVSSSPILSVGAAPKPASARPAGPSTVVVPAVIQGGQEAAVAEVNQHLQQVRTDLKLQVDAGSGRTVFQVVQQGTGQVVLQIPSEEVLQMSRRLREMDAKSSSSGALVDKNG